MQYSLLYTSELAKELKIMMWMAPYQNHYIYLSGGNAQTPVFVKVSQV